MCETQTTWCSANPATPTCQNGGYCYNSTTGYQCSCPCGFAGTSCEIAASNIRTASVMQFASDGYGGIGYRLALCQGQCQNGGTCLTLLNGQNFYCACKSGWSGTYCQYVVRSSAAGVAPSLLAVAAALFAAVALKH